MTEIEQCLNCKRPECNNCLGDITGGNRTYTPEIKAEAAQRYRSGQSIQKIAQDTRIPKDTIRYWIKKAGKT